MCMSAERGMPYSSGDSAQPHNFVPLYTLLVDMLYCTVHTFEFSRLCMPYRFLTRWQL